jgi:hypothetical protein
MNAVIRCDEQELCLDSSVSNVIVGLSLLAAGVERPSMTGRLRIIFVTKFPPIMGGVASQQYWRARRLAQLGHRVTVVTDANDAHTELRAAMSASDFDWLNFECKESGGTLRTLFTEPSYSDEVMRFEHYHIPGGPMSFSKLRGLAFQVSEEEQPDLVVVGYLEPYASVACELQRVFGIPACLGFAGSDIARLARIPELGRCYREDITGAAAVLATWEHVPRLFAMGMRLESYQHAPPPLLPDDVFACSGGTEETNRADWRLGIYGKVATPKRWTELVLAIANLRKAGVPVSLCGHIGGEGAERLRAFVRERRLEDVVSLSGPIMPWQVPTFVKSCDAICCLETEFDLDVHEPIVPYEAAKLGVLPILSSELASKLRGWELKNPHAAIVSDPRDITCLEETLRGVYLRPRSGHRQAAGRAIRGLLPNGLDGAEATSRLLDSVVRASRRRPENASQPSRATSLHLRTLFHAFYPATAARLGVETPHLGNGELPSTPTTLLLYLQAAGMRLLADVEAGPGDPIGEDCLRYELARVVCFALGRAPFAAHSFDLDRSGKCVDVREKSELEPTRLYPTPLCRVVLVDSCTNLPDVYGLRRRRTLPLRVTGARQFAMRASSDAEPIAVLIPPGGDALLRYADGQRTLAELSRLASVAPDVLQHAFEILRRARMLTFCMRKTAAVIRAEPVSIACRRTSNRDASSVVETTARVRPTPNPTWSCEG